MSPAELRVAEFFQKNREEVLFTSAAALAAKTGTSDATVVRTTKTLGFTGMDELRRALAAELKQGLSLAGRLRGTLREVGDDLQAAFERTLDIHLDCIDELRRNIRAEDFRKAIDFIIGARRVVIFGIGPSSSLADYFVIQLRRFGFDAQSLTRTGLLFADDLRTLKAGDHLIILAYGRLYRELSVLLEEADRHAVAKTLMTDTLRVALRRRVDLILPIARGRADALSLHTATLALVEALLVGVAARRPRETILSLEYLNVLREKLTGRSTKLPSLDEDDNDAP